jgi:arsenate reductase
MQRTRLYHNPRCSKSRAALELLAGRVADLEVVDYLQMPPSPIELRELLDLLRMPARDLVRTGELEYTAMALDRADLDDTILINAMAAHPCLIERPIFVHGGRAVIGRPPERVLELLG